MGVPRGRPGLLCLPCGWPALGGTYFLGKTTKAKARACSLVCTPGEGGSCQVLPSEGATGKQGSMQTNLKTNEGSEGSDRGSSLLLLPYRPDTTVHPLSASPHFGKEERILMAGFKDDEIQTHRVQVLNQSNPMLTD